MDKSVTVGFAALFMLVQATCGNSSMNGHIVPAHKHDSLRIAQRHTLAAGGQHSLVIGGKSPLVYSFGDNGSWQLGRVKGPADDAAVPITGWDKVVAVSAGESHSLFLNASGQVFGVGKNDFGQLGRSIPVTLRSPTKIEFPSGAWSMVHVAAGKSFSLALSANGQLFSWGANQYGQLGRAASTSPPSSEPTPVSIPDSELSEVVTFAAGSDHSLALDAQGQLYAWGKNDRAQVCGQGAACTDTRGALRPIISKPTSLTVDCAGVPLEPIIAMAAGFDHSLALSSSGSVYAWGSNLQKQLTSLAPNPSKCPFEVSLPGTHGGITQLAAGKGFSLALTADGRLFAWGANDRGQLGTGDTVLRGTPIEIKLPEALIEIVAGTSHVLGKSASGKTYAWGLNSSGQLAQDSTKVPSASTPQQAVGIEIARRATGLAAGDSHLLVLLSDSSILSAGSQKNGRQGNVKDDDSLIGLSEVLRYEGLSSRPIARVTMMATGMAHSLLLLSDGEILPFGSNLRGELGLSYPVPDPMKAIGGVSFCPASKTIANTGLRVVQIAAAQTHSLAVRADGSVLAWGLNANYELGLTTGTIKNAPEAIPLLWPVRQVSVGEEHSMLLTEWGEVYTMGSNRNGQLGVRSVLVPTSVPTLVTALTKQVVSITACGQSSFAITSDGSAFAWGSNSMGQLGLGLCPAVAGNHTIATPTVIAALNAPVAEITCSGVHTLFRMADGSLYATGAQNSGQLGAAGAVDDGSCLTSAESGDVLPPIRSLVPVKVQMSTPLGVTADLGDVVKAVAGASADSPLRKGYSAAITADGRLWTWGAITSGSGTLFGTRVATETPF